ncbi:MAG TPA: hypothetical protein VFW64_21340 [Pseudonocardiaceae bacterium]|nr:hypothetical protein [Pseudonocardiaceae bacterium]
MSRTWDGSPETPRDSRFFDLRESGYTGWIDQDGYAVTTCPLCGQEGCTRDIAGHAS